MGGGNQRGEREREERLRGQMEDRERWGRIKRGEREKRD